MWPDVVQYGKIGIFSEVLAISRQKQTSPSVVKCLPKRFDQNWNEKTDKNTPETNQKWAQLEQEMRPKWNPTKFSKNRFYCKFPCQIE